jgi:SAM-dependent methyltransferase
MPAANYQELIDHYESCLAAHGDTHRGVDWPNAADADTRYRVMLEVMRPKHAAETSHQPQRLRLLDFGCGAAHLLEHLKRHGHDNIDYIGVDASEKFIDLCRQKFPRAEFHAIDLLAGDAELPAADYTIMNGVLTEKRGLSFDAMWDFAAELLPRIFAATRVGLAFNVMSAHVDWERDDLFHVPYDRLAALLKARLSRHFQFRADYGLYEYTTYVYREPRSRSHVSS